MKRICFGLLLLYIAVYLLPLGCRSLAIPDEMRYGEIAREMLASGDFVTPRLNGLRYFEKPAGGHVLNAASMAAFGETNFAVRLMSALAAGLSAWGLFALLKRRLGLETAALAALIFLTCGEMMVIGTFSVLDSMVSGFITLSLCCCYAALDAAGKKRAGWLALSGAFAGGAFLVKGFIAVAVPVVVVVPYLLLRRQWKQLFIVPWIPLAAALAVALPWCLAIADREPDFWRYFFWEEHVRRFFSQGEAQHAHSFWYFFPVLIAGAIPWAFIAPLPLRDLVRRRRREPLVQFALCWLVAPLLFFSASSGKLATYILPCFAPFALLLALALADRSEEGGENRSLLVGSSIFATILATAMVGLLVVGGLCFLEVLPPLDAHFTLKFCGALAGLALAVWLALSGRGNRQKTVRLGLSAAVLSITFATCIPTEVSQAFGLQGFLESERSRIEPDTILVGVPRTAHSLCYVYKRDDVYLFRRAGELTYGVSYPEAAHRLLDMPDLERLLLQRGGRRVVLAMKSSQGVRIKAELPMPDYEREWLKIWYAVYEPLTENVNNPTTRIAL
ncbi:Undecaprenyl phosphate-alpha-4-amino-4-deoxy-L-arabinose arabinosyl transferase [Pontiella sulfatireligans]|uniref:Undecaprenyl phosphate-alpha-4-amino-4-deoxy-L-arabinose arabinosyl transferase n=2 Tax=Pontiella sulfatireligans TaxID=2750658 RepID=A0A6C2UL76_9BACT|nr:Undecaprenyl phosphate-alpha-4-amino-4-deoxy-L-arabinose arabinosyl transferase [Pontiella sulfatireligans]